MTTDFKRTLRPFTTNLGERRDIKTGRDVPHIVSVFVFVVYEKGKLSISGVEGPYSNGDCAGSAGQIDMHEWTPHTFADGWDADMVAKLRAVWQEHHLNDMRPYTPEMKAAGWPEIAARRMEGHEFTQSLASIKERNEAKDAALAALRAGETFTPTQAQVKAATRPHSFVVWQPEGLATPGAPEGYEAARHLYGPQQGALKRPEVKTLGWLYPSDHPEGLLGRKLAPGDAHGYGGKWWKEDVPADVLKWLRGLPVADKACPGNWAR